MEPIVIVRILLILRNIDIQVCISKLMKLVMNNIVDKTEIMRSFAFNFAIHCEDLIT